MWDFNGKKKIGTHHVRFPGDYSVAFGNNFFITRDKILIGTILRSLNWRGRRRYIKSSSLWLPANNEIRKFVFREKQRMDPKKLLTNNIFHDFVMGKVIREKAFCLCFLFKRLRSNCVPCLVLISNFPSWEMIIYSRIREVKKRVFTPLSFTLFTLIHCGPVKRKS